MTKTRSLMGESIICYTGVFHGEREYTMDTSIVTRSKDGKKYPSWKLWAGAGCSWWKRPEPKEIAIEKVEEMTQENEPMADFNPVLYHVVRLDIPQLNPGKAVAQGMHGQSMVSETVNYIKRHNLSDSMHIADMYDKWILEGEGFGTTIVLEATKDDWVKFYSDMDAETDQQKFIVETVIDKTYPMTNHYGEYFTAEMVTGWSVFAHSPEVLAFMKKSFPLCR